MSKPLDINKLLKSTGKTLIMGILNVTPDSFSDGGKYLNLDDAINHVKNLIEAGADIIDIGGESTRPGANYVSEEEELRRVIPVIKELRALRLDFGSLSSEILISIDTYKSNVAQLALIAGANMINDVSGLTMDPDMVKVAARADCPIVIMHNNGIPATKPETVNSHCEQSEAISKTLKDCHVGSSEPPRNDVVREVYAWLEKQINYAIKNNVKKENIIIDPGIGFGKTAEEDLFLIENLKEFQKIGYPILLGPSKKSFIKKIFDEADIETKSKEIMDLAISNGVNILRLHEPQIMNLQQQFL